MLETTIITVLVVNGFLALAAVIAAITYVAEFGEPIPALVWFLVALYAGMNVWALAWGLDGLRNCLAFMG